MSLSPSHRDRERIPHQPRPPKHWPMDCEEREPAAKHRIFWCETCRRTFFEPKEEMGPEYSGLSCYGNGTAPALAEPRE